MKRTEKEHVVAELVERLRTSDTLIVADYRGLPMTELDGVRTELLKHGARFSVVKNTLTKRAAEAAGMPELNELLEGPTAIAFVADGDMVAVAKTLNETARRTRILALRGGILQGRRITAEDVRDLASLPPADVLRGQVLGAVVGPLTAIVGLFTAPLREFVGVIDARIRQLESGGVEGVGAGHAPPEADEGTPPDTGETAASAEAPAPEAAETDADEPPPDEPQPEGPGSAEDPQTPAADATEAAEAEIQAIGDEQANEEE